MIAIVVGNCEYGRALRQATEALAGWQTAERLREIAGELDALASGEDELTRFWRIASEDWFSRRDRAARLRTARRDDDPPAGVLRPRRRIFAAERTRGPRPIRGFGPNYRGAI